MNSDTFKRGIAKLGLAFESRLEDNQARLDLYWEQVRHVGDVEFLAAVEYCIRTCRFFPKIAELREALDGIRRATGASPALGEDAWAAFLRRLSRWNPDTGIVSDGTRGLVRSGDEGSGLYDGLDPLTKTVVDGLGGAQSILAKDERDLAFARRDFVAHYDRLCHRRVVAAQLAGLGTGGDATPAFGALLPSIRGAGVPATVLASSGPKEA